MRKNATTLSCQSRSLSHSWHFDGSTHQDQWSRVRRAGVSQPVQQKDETNYDKYYIFSGQLKGPILDSRRAGIKSFVYSVRWLTAACQDLHCWARHRHSGLGSHRRSVPCEKISSEVHVNSHVLPRVNQRVARLGRFITYYVKHSSSCDRMCLHVHSSVSPSLGITDLQKVRIQSWFTWIVVHSFIHNRGNFGQLTEVRFHACRRGLNGHRLRFTSSLVISKDCCHGQEW